MRIKKLFSIILVFAFLITLTGCRSSDYESALNLMEEQEWTQARELFISLGDYKDSAERITECDYNIALDAMQDGDYAEASERFEALGDYKDSSELFTECSYQNGLGLYESGDFGKACLIFEELDGYKDSDRHAVICSLLADQNRFADDFTDEMDSVYDELGLPYTLKYKGDTIYDERGFTVAGRDSTGLTSVYFSHITEDWGVSRDGQINGMLIMGTSSSKEEIPAVYQEFVSTSAATLYVLDDSETAQELSAMINEKTSQLLAGGLAPVTEYTNGANCEFEYEGYDCFLGIIDMGDDYIRFTFSAVVPELLQ